jgi:hypothetical protein
VIVLVMQTDAPFWELMGIFGFGSVRSSVNAQVGGASEGSFGRVCPGMASKTLEAPSATSVGLCLAHAATDRGPAAPCWSTSKPGFGGAVGQHVHDPFGHQPGRAVDTASTTLPDLFPHLFVRAPGRRRSR